MRFIPLLTSLFALLIAAEGMAQNCGCADAGNCTFPFSANSNTQVCYDITDAFNNDLASPTQGVCGVRVRFRHGRIGSLDLTLTSPNGTQVQLVGASGTCSTATPVAVWDILFVPCLEDCDPDTVNGCAYPCIFDGCPNDCPWQNANYTGSYFPALGCLENFNSGSANGTWCLEIDNNATFNGGSIFDFEVILCDQSGFFCCDADAGNLNFEPDVNACLGDSSLQISPEPQYGAVVPDSAEYGYTYAVFQNSNLLTYDTTNDFRSYPAGNYKVCGLSYFLEDTLNLPAPGTPLTPAGLNANLTGATPLFCGDIDTNCILVRISAPLPPMNLSQTICEGDTVFMGSNAYTTSGTFSDTLASFGGCDSIINLSLTVELPDTTDFAATVCDGEDYIIGNDTFSTPGTHTVLLQNVFGCDSTVTLTLTILPPISTSLTDTICFGDTVWIGTMPFTTQGVYAENLVSDFGCDSLVNLDLTVVFVGVSIAPADTLTCQQISVLLNASASTTLGSLNYQWTTDTGNFPGSTTAPTVMVDDPGNYFVVVQSLGCFAFDTVAVVEDADIPNAVAASISPDTLSCVVSSVQLDGNGSTGGNLVFQWSAQNGSPISNPTLPNVTISEPDTYILMVTDLANNCSDSESVTIFENTTPPLANAGADTMLSCSVAVVNLDGSGSQPSSPTSAGISFEWSANPGNILPPADIATPAVDAPGTYQLIVTDFQNGCRDTDLVVVNVDLLTPQAVIIIPGSDSLTCFNSVVTLDGTGSTGNQNVEFQWIGGIAGGQGTLTATVMLPGQYLLVASDSTNGCVDTAVVTILQDTLSPQADAGMSDTLSCMHISASLGGNGTSAGGEFEYEWTNTPGGSLASPPNAPFVTADSAGTYYLSVTNIFNGCVALDSVTVFDNLFPPVADAGADGLLSCQDSTFLLDASGSTIEPFTILEWQDASGTSLGNSPQVNVNYADTFIVTVSFAFCESRDTAIVSMDVSLPLVNAGSDVGINCTTGQITLDGGGTSIGTDFTYLWTTPDGIISFGENTLAPVAESPGTYILTVTNELSQCTATDSTLVTLDSAACLPLVNAGANGLYNCYSIDFQDTLTASASVGANYSYAWSAISGLVIDSSDPFAPIVTPGEFVFAVTNNAVGLTAYDTVSVLADTLPPLADAGDIILPLTCPELAVCHPLDANNSSQGANFNYTWDSSDGTFCTAANILNPEVLGEGTYNLRVLNLDNGCSASDGVLVQLLDFEPVADAGADLQMLCGDSVAIPGGSGTSVGANYSYEWFSPDGTIVGNGDTTNPQVTPPAGADSSFFYLAVLNTLNFCRDTDEVVVFSPQGCYPECAASVSGDLTCAVDSVVLSGAGSSIGLDLSYQWTVLGSGSLCGGDMALDACADAEGFYRLTVTRTYASGAQFSTECTVQVEDDIQAPIADAGANANLTCTDTTLQLNGGNSSTGNIFSYFWTSATGNIFSGDSTATPLVDEPGTYNLLVTNTFNGCTATDFLTVGIDTIHPNADAGAGDQLTCGAGTAILDGTSMPPGLIFCWTASLEGEICAGMCSPNPIVCAAGTYYLIVTNPVNGCTDSDSTIVTQDSDAPVVDAGADLTYNCRDTVFTLAASANGGSLLTYQWTALNGGCIIGASNILQPMVGCPGDYRLTVMDQINGCIAVSQMTVFADTLLPVADAGMGEEINCQNLIIELDGSASTPAGQLDFIWSAGLPGHFLSAQATANPTVDSAGIYQLIVTNQLNHCKDTAVVAITRDVDIPVADAGLDTTLTCARLHLDLDGLGSSVSSTIVYTWTTFGGNILDGENTLTPTIDKAGSYALNVFDSGSLCEVNDTVAVTLDTLSPTADIDTSQTLVITCAVQDVALDGSLSAPGGELDFHWTTLDGHIVTGVNDAVSHVDSGGWYQLLVTQQRNGCTATDSVFVAEDFEMPAVIFAAALELTCERLSVQLEVLPPTNQPVYQYAWSGPPVITDASTRTPTVSNPGVYSVTITNTNNGCENGGTTFVTEDLIAPDAVAATFGTLDCDNLTAEVSGQGSSIGNVSYLWTSDSGGNIAAPTQLATEVDAAGWYFLSVRRLDNGCTDSDSTEVIATATPIDSALLSLQNPGCNDPEGYIFIDSVLGGAPPFYYSLDGDIFITYPQFSFLDPGQHVVTIEDENGCEWTTTVLLTQPGELSVELGEDIFIHQGESADLLAQTSLPFDLLDTVIWQTLPDSAGCPGCLEQTVFPKETTTYRITVKDTSGCEVNDRITVWVNEERPFFVPTAFSPNGDGINDLLLLYAGADVPLIDAFRIFDRWGDMVFFAEGFVPNDPAFGWDGRFEGKSMNSQVLVWVAELSFLDGEKEVFHGEVALVR